MLDWVYLDSKYDLPSCAMHMQMHCYLIYISFSLFETLKLFKHRNMLFVALRVSSVLGCISARSQSFFTPVSVIIITAM